MVSRAFGYYISVEKLRPRKVGKGMEYVYDYESPKLPDKQSALQWAYLCLPATKYGFLMRAHSDPDDDEIKGCAHWVKRKNGHVLIFEDEDVVFRGGKEFGYVYDVTAIGTLINKR